MKKKSFMSSKAFLGNRIECVTLPGNLFVCKDSESYHHSK